MARAKALADLGDTDLLERLSDSKEELFNLRFQAATGQRRYLAQRLVDLAFAELALPGIDQGFQRGQRLGLGNRDKAYVLRRASATPRRRGDTLADFRESVGGAVQSASPPLAGRSRSNTSRNRPVA